MIVMKEKTFCNPLQKVFKLIKRVDIRNLLSLEYVGME